MSLLRFLPRPTVGTCRNLQHCQSHARTLRMRYAVVCGLKLADPGITTEPRGLTASQPRPADIFTAAAVSGRWRRPGRVCGFLCCCGSSWRRSAGGIWSQTLALQKRNRGTATTGYSLSPSCLDSGWATAPSRNSHASARHCLQSERSADVG